MSDFLKHLYRSFDTVDPEDMDDDGKMTSEAVCEVRAIDVIAAIDRIKELEAENANLRAERAMEYLRGRKAADDARADVENSYIASLKVQLAEVQAENAKLRELLRLSWTDPSDDDAPDYGELRMHVIETLNLKAVKRE